MIAWSEHPRWGNEFDWFAVDLQGFVGLFSTAGYGPVPSAVVAHAEEIEGWSSRWRDQLPRSGSCVDQPRCDGNFADWITAAERGLYGFDWEVWDGPYSRLTVPSDPVQVSDLPLDLERLARLVPLQVEFAFTASVAAHQQVVAQPAEEENG